MVGGALVGASGALLVSISAKLLPTPDYSHEPVMSLRHAHVVLSFLSTLGACSSALVQHSAEAGVASRSSEPSMVGCYRMQGGVWTPKGEPGLEPPLEFRLDSDVTRNPLTQIGSRSVILIGPHESRSTLGGWRFVGPDSILVSWWGGLSGGGYKLHAKGDSLVGVAWTWSDVRTGDPDPRAAVIGARMPCPS